MVHCKNLVTGITGAHGRSSAHPYARVPLCKHNGWCGNGFVLLLTLKQALRKIHHKILKAVLNILQQTNTLKG